MALIGAAAKWNVALPCNSNGTIRWPQVPCHSLLDVLLIVFFDAD